MNIKKRVVFSAAAGATSLALLCLASNNTIAAAAEPGDRSGETSPQYPSADGQGEAAGLTKLREGRQIFRYDTLFRVVRVVRGLSKLPFPGWIKDAQAVFRNLSVGWQVLVPNFALWSV
jgi:hypothetical protein